MRKRTIIEVIRAEINQSRFTRAEISRYTGVQKAVITKIMAGGDCKSWTAGLLLKFFGYTLTKEKKR